MGGKEQLFQSGVSVWASGQRVGQGVCGEPCTRPQLQASTVGLPGHTQQARRLARKEQWASTTQRGKSTSTATAQGKPACHANDKALPAARCQLPPITYHLSPASSHPPAQTYQLRHLQSSGLPTCPLASLCPSPKPEAPLDRHPPPPQLAARRETLVSCRSISPEPRLSCA